LLLSGRERLGQRARDVVLNRRNRVAISAATIWEVEIKRALGKLVSPDDLTEQLAAHGFIQLPIRWEHAVAAGRLPAHHRDPFDRMLIAQAMLEDLVVVTSDESFARYDVRTLEALA
jgi:PIN domain nuclease of toxin-antitoxin system